MDHPQTIEVKLLGQRFVLKCSETDPDTIREVLQVVNFKLGEAESRSQKASPHQVALVALCDLAEEYIKVIQRNAELRQSDSQWPLESPSNRLQTY